MHVHEIDSTLTPIILTIAPTSTNQLSFYERLVRIFFTWRDVDY